MHFFASRGAASTWLGARTGITILTVEEAFKLADEVWLNETLWLLQELDEGPLWDDPGELSDEEWFQELEWLDEGELSVRS